MTVEKYQEIAELKASIDYLERWIRQHGNKGITCIDGGAPFSRDLEYEMREACIGLAFVELDKLQAKFAAL